MISGESKDQEESLGTRKVGKGHIHILLSLIITALAFFSSVPH